MVVSFLGLVKTFAKPVSGTPGADTGGVDRVDIHPPFFSKKKIRNVTLFEIENK